jgi:uncharacterized protein YbaR (Trm112 family)
MTATDPGPEETVTGPGEAVTGPEEAVTGPGEAVAEPGRAEAATLDGRLLPLLACPVDKEALLYFSGDGLLYNPRLRLGYRVEDGIPVLLAGEAEELGAERHATLTARAGRGEATATLGRDPAGLAGQGETGMADAGV